MELTTAMLKIMMMTLTLALPALVACSEGPVESAGRSIDKAGQNIRDTVDPPRGPVERMGRSIDRAMP